MGQLVDLVSFFHKVGSHGIAESQERKSSISDRRKGDRRGKDVATKGGAAKYAGLYQLCKTLHDVLPDLNMALGSIQAY